MYTAALQVAYGTVFEPRLITEIEEVARFLSFKKADILIDAGQYIKVMPLLVEGAIRIMREDPWEGELLLYFLEKGDTCAMTLACCLGDKKSEIKAVAETDALVAMIPVSKMEEWLAKYSSWRNFVFTSYNRRMEEMLGAIDQLAFHKMDVRILHYLEEITKINNTRSINKSHQEIADALNTSRVVVSRILKVYENEGKVRLNRSTIDLL
ncbi:cyclic nucleotide-binding domain protein [Sphingobacterium spiritivorum ATCC 33300]|uniref:Cyclic nucleotide-binding domain protein n=1 Tax=Sphingobacterium spiritivorum ATCC 33300 TaxID=525372 RepID=C2FZG4_SPHSI|nr:Crp/Fnr family transcriptional regulator [Sphingobacterium spiritivorum]EEI91677.1 cyclic nucleotide-binding domain protein [Sphingobacterium spiritivorum ATCC 33300]QQS97145.1 Crp/Fnr family transcriptional regulator [Sphingobacterium spiritivorum]